MATVRHDPKVYNFCEKGGIWELSGFAKFRVSVALMCPILGGSRMIVFLNRETGEYSLPGFWTETLSGKSPEQVALVAIENIVSKDISGYRLLQYQHRVFRTDLIDKMIEDEKGTLKPSSVEIFPICNKLDEVPKAAEAGEIYYHTYVALHDNNIEVTFAYELCNVEKTGRFTSNFLTADDGFQVSQLTTRRLMSGLKLAKTPASENLIHKILLSFGS